MRSKFGFFIALLTITLAMMLPPVFAQTFKSLHQFNSDSDGAFSQGNLLRDAAGNLYGTTTGGGFNVDAGTVFRIDHAGAETVLLAFDTFVSGTFPSGTLIQDSAGNLYGIAEGGPGGAGVAYRLSPQGEQQVLFAFQGGLTNHKPKLPSGGLFMDNVGNIFGTAEFGGNDACHLGCGSVFRLDKTGTLSQIHKFNGANGSQPSGPLVQDANGALYGVARSGGNLSCAEFPGTGCGTVFKLSKDRQFTILHTFQGGKDGAAPQGGLLMDADGNLYGTTGSGGKSGHGLIFKISKDGTYQVLHRFSRQEGTTPNGGLVSDEQGNLFGTAQLGGAHNLGTAFKFSIDGKLEVLHSFKGLKDGAVPFAGLIRDSDGNLYGTTLKNFLIQTIQGGSVFEITP
jgi:uncharacterized repeat protein (TIGR03803 family)